MSDRAGKWQADFQKFRSTAAQVNTELQRWELLASQSATPRGERARQGAVIRAKISQLKLELERLQRELDGLSDKNAEKGVTRKSITQFRDDLAQASAELTELQRRTKGAPSSSPVPSPPPTPGRHFVQLPGDAPASRTGSGAELQPVSQRAMLQQQQQAVRDLEEPLSALEGTVNNLAQVSTMIRGEIVGQNRMLDNVNDAADRVQTRLGRARSLMARFSREDRSRWLVCAVLLLIGVLIAIMIYIVAP